MILKAKEFNRRSEAAATWLEIMAIVSVSLLVAAVVFVAMRRSRASSCRLGCANCMKQIGLSFRTWELDNSDLFSMHVSVTNGGTMELATNGAVFPHFVVMSNELSTPKILLCPDDARRRYAASFTNLTDANISYFVNLDSLEKEPSTLLAGDGNLTNQRPAGSKFISVNNTTTLGWTKALHSKKGYLLFADGSVNQFANGIAVSSFGITNGVTNRLVIP